MENSSFPTPKLEDEQMELPPGFRFHPTDEELITHYLSPKVLDSCFCARAIGEVDLNKCEPWDLPWRAKMGEKERYLFCVRDRKYPTGLRTNRATEGGYWKATGKDREIHRGRSLVGMKKTLVFYRGRDPKGGKSNWVMHEFRLEGKFPHSLPKSALKEWVICRIFQKSEVGKKVQISDLPPLIETAESSRVNCFSNPVEDRKSETDIIQTPNASFVASSSSSSSLNPKIPSPFRSILSSKVSLPPSFSSPISPAMGNLAYPASLSMAGQSVLRTLGENHGLNWDNWDVKQSDGGREFSDGPDISSAVSNRQIAQRDFVASVATFDDLDCLWNYSD